MAKHDETIVETITHLKRQDPFVPFEVVMASGDRYLIDNPDALAIATSQLHYYPRFGNGIHLRLNQVVAVEESRQKPAA